MRALLLRLLGVEPGGIDSASYRDGWNAGHDRARQESIEAHADAWKEGYRYARDEWQAARAVEDAEIVELAMLTQRAVK